MEEEGISLKGGPRQLLHLASFGWGFSERVKQLERYYQCAIKKKKNVRFYFLFPGSQFLASLAFFGQRKSSLENC